VRYREVKLSDLDRTRKVVAAWRAEHPAGTVEQLVADVGTMFHPDWGVVLRGTLVAVDRHRAREVTGVVTGTATAAR
jgi:hypothetical protein